MAGPLSFATALCGFHVAVTLLALYRARSALRVAGDEGRLDRPTLLRLAAVRFVAAVVSLTGGFLAIAFPLAFVVARFPALMPTTPETASAMLTWAWLLWIPSTLALDNLALKWLRRPGEGANGAGEVDNADSLRPMP